MPHEETIQARILWDQKYRAEVSEGINNLCFQDFLLVLSLHCSILLCQFLESSGGSAFPFPVVFTGKKSQTKCRCSAASQGVEYTGQIQAPEANPARLFIFIYISWWFCAWLPRLADPRAYILTSNMDKDRRERFYYLLLARLRVNHTSENSMWVKSHTDCIKFFYKMFTKNHDK